LVFAATKDLRDKVDADNKKAELAADAEKADKLRQSYFDAVRERIKFASQVDRRPSWDLREEERTVVYRQLIRALMLDSWEELDKNAAKADLAAKLEEARRIAHVRSEMIRAIFDVDEMLYFVAPEWWAPRIHRSAQDFEQSTTGHTLTSGETVGWGGIREAGRDNYRITEESDPAPLGASLGWLLQLDGDNLRNAFLNSPWVKAVVPIRPGREMAALNWLRALEKDDGLEAPYVGAEPEFAGMTLGEVLEDVAAQVQAKNGDFTNVLQADKVFESGFDPLEKAFDAAAPAGSVFSQWISILPTDQIVAMIYDPVVDP